MVDSPEKQWNQMLDELRQLRCILYDPDLAISDTKRRLLTEHSRTRKAKANKHTAKHTTHTLSNPSKEE